MTAFSQRKTVGVIGGMGPAATVDLYAKIIQCTAATTDQEHLHVLIDSNTQIPDRTGAILNGGGDPLPALIETAQRLERAGAEVLAISCNTAHWYYNGIQGAVSIPVLHMIAETAAYIRQFFPGAARVGLMATDGTLYTGLYERALAAEGLFVLQPDPEQQVQLMRSIYDGVKAGNLHLGEKWAAEVAGHLAERGAQVLVLGCTELPIALRSARLPVPAVDPTYVLARACVLAAAAPLVREREI